MSDSIAGPSANISHNTLSKDADEDVIAVGIRVVLLTEDKGARLQSDTTKMPC